MNQALQLLNRQIAPADVVARLAAQLGVSTRQASRYVRVAQESSSPLPIPEEKAVFTVKLSKKLILKVRRSARAQERSISDWVADALEKRLEGAQRHG